jgi:hydroxymethylpyrimidine pyrophosphatase-like HAD family hydrolase
MDYYLDTNNSLNRLLQEYNNYKSIVIAFDFDDTVFDFHKKGRTYCNVIELLGQLKEINCYLICWTGQDDLEFVKDYLKKNDIPFDAINENPPFHQAKSKKIYANAYLDDRAGLKQVFDDLTTLVKTVKL